MSFSSAARSPSTKPSFSVPPRRSLNAEKPSPFIQLAPRTTPTGPTSPEADTFACLRLAREAGEVGGTAPCVVNAADEVAVGAFLDRKIGFTDIPRVIDRCLDEVPTGPAAHFEELFETDERAREHARNLVEGHAVA